MISWCKSADVEWLLLPPRLSPGSTPTLNNANVQTAQNCLSAHKAVQLDVIGNMGFPIHQSSFALKDMIQLGNGLQNDGLMFTHIPLHWRQFNRSAKFVWRWNL